MKVVVIKKFRDKNKNVIRKLGDKFDCSPKRFLELAGYVEEIKIVKK